MRYRAVISYFGANYVGWQKQLNGISVQEVLEGALTKVFGAKTAATASGRTDAGVHAEGQVVHFDAETSIPPNKIPYAVNAALPRDISVLSCEVVDDAFNARFSAKRKTYCYRLYLANHVRPLLEHTHALIVQPLDVEKMKQAAKIIEGEHDFKCFEATGSVVKNTVRTIYNLDINVTPFVVSKNAADKNNSTALDNDVERHSESETTIGCETQAANIEITALENDIKTDNATQTDNNNKSIAVTDEKAAISKDGKVFDAEVTISVTGNGFLYNMVRIIAGTLVYVGLSKLTPQDVETILKTGDRTSAGKTLPPEGLSLISVEY